MGHPDPQPPVRQWKIPASHPGSGGAVRLGDPRGRAGCDPGGLEVAAVAVERDLPLVVLPGGTLNHFAAYAGLDRNDSLTPMAEVENGTELRVDVGSVNGWVFMNNASIGCYGWMVQDPQYPQPAGCGHQPLPAPGVRGGGASMTVSLTLAARIVVR